MADSFVLPHPAGQTWRWWRRSFLPDTWQASLLELSAQLLAQPDDDAPLRHWLDGLQRWPGVEQATLLLPGDDAFGFRELGAASGCAEQPGCPWYGPQPRLPDSEALLACQACQAQGRRRLVCGLGAQAALLLQCGEARVGRVSAELPPLARHLGALLAGLEHQRQQRRRELTAERGALSHELHDTVAQQLSYLQIRVHRLQRVLGDPAQSGQAEAMLVDLRDTLQQLHRQVRELIATARLTMDGRSLREALEASVDEFARRSACVFDLDNRLPPHCLSPEAELQILQVVREALANVVRHSHARRVSIRLAESAGGLLEVLVEDDGIGLPQALEEDRHFGLRIMRERVEGLGGELQIGPAQPQGTRIHLIWRRT